jgi:DDE superfamily endonuclease
VRTLPATMIRLLVSFVPLFSRRIWQNAQVLLMGVILAPGRRTVSSAVRAMGLDQHKGFHRYQRVLSHASWSSLKASRILLGLLVEISELCQLRHLRRSAEGICEGPHGPQQPGCRQRRDGL